MAWIKKYVYELTAFYKESDELPISETENYLTYEEALKAKEEWLEDPDIQEVIISDEPIEMEIIG